MSACSISKEVTQLYVNHFQYYFDIEKHRLKREMIAHTGSGTQIFFYNKSQPN